MDKNILLLKDAYNLFINAHQDFAYLLSDIELWIASENEYPEVYKKAKSFLNIPVKETTEHLEHYSLRFRAELLKNRRNAVIVLNGSLLVDKHEALMIVIHELSHAYYDDLVRVEPPDINAKKFLFQIGERMWREVVAEYYTWDILCDEISLNNYDIEGDFKSLLNDMSFYPERMGFFFFKCKMMGLTVADVFSMVGIKKVGLCYNKLFSSVKEILDMLTEELNQMNRNRRITSAFYVMLGARVFTFVYYYMSHYEHINEFLKQIE